MYENEYYFLTGPSNEALPVLQPDEDTAKLNYMFEAMPTGSKPLVFCNGAAQMQKAQRIQVVSPPPAIMFNGTDVLLPDEIRTMLLQLEIPNLVAQPSIYIDDDGKWHENFWYLTFLSRFDCWDKETSDYDREDPISLGGMDLFDVFSFKLDKDLLSRTPLVERLIFKMAGVNPAPITVHSSIAGAFRHHGRGACELVKVSQWKG